MSGDWSTKAHHTYPTMVVTIVIIATVVAGIGYLVTGSTAYALFGGIVVSSLLAFDDYS